jgi:hypothetical protein
MRRRRLAGDLRLEPPGPDAIRPYSAPGRTAVAPPGFSPADLQARLAGGGGERLPLKPFRAPGTQTPCFQVGVGAMM